MSRAAKELAGLRKKVGHTCPVCQKQFQAIKKAVYCSNACRQRAKYKRGKVISERICPGCGKHNQRSGRGRLTLFGKSGYWHDKCVKAAQAKERESHRIRG